MTINEMSPVVQTASITQLTQELVQIPSQGGIDPYPPIVEHLTGWLADAGLQPDVLTDDDGPVAVTCTVAGSQPGPHLVLDACLDTAAAGDRDTWDRDPFSGDIENGWLYGRGSSDSKAAISLFSHLASELNEHRNFVGQFSLLFDLDEHTGGFAGIRRYLQDAPPIDGVMIGYPGTSKIVVGGRGFWRATIPVHGRSAHTGSSSTGGVNAIVRATRLAGMLAAVFPTEPDPVLGLPPKLTITSISGGMPGSWSVVPDRCEISIDVRLTPGFTAGAAQSLVGAMCLELDETDPVDVATSVHRSTETWPAFRLPDDHPLPGRLRAGAVAAGLDPRLAVAGPSNIGCLLADRGIPATAGFGVGYVGLHAANEAIDLATVPAVYAAYRSAIIGP